MKLTLVFRKDTIKENPFSQGACLFLWYGEFEEDAVLTMDKNWLSSTTLFHLFFKTIKSNGAVTQTTNPNSPFADQAK